MEIHNQEPNNQIDELMGDLFVGEIKEADTRTPDLWFAVVWICDNVVHFKLDTGSEANVLPIRTYNKIWATPLQKSTCMLVTCSGHCSTPDEEVTLLVKDQKINFQVVPECQAILGKTACVKLKLLAQLDKLAID